MPVVGSIRFGVVTTADRDCTANNTATRASARNRDQTGDRDSDRTTDHDSDRTSTAIRDRTSTATRSDTSGIFDRIRDSTARHRDRTAIATASAPHLVLPSLDRLSAPPGGLPRARRGRARRVLSRVARYRPFISDFEYFYTPDRRQARHPLRPILESGPDAICWQPEPNRV